MSAKIPIVRFRPTHVADGKGGFVDSYDDPYQCFGSVEMHKNVVTLIIDRMENVRIGDVIMIEDEIDLDPAFYAVMDALQIARGTTRTFILQRRDRPIWPLAGDYLAVDGIPLVLDGHLLTVEA